MRFHVDSDLGSEISLWIAPDHPDQVPQISIWDAERHITTMKANLLREDVRQLGMHSTGQVGFSITSDIVADIERMADLAVMVEGDETDGNQGVVIYRRAGTLLNRAQRLLIIDTAPGRNGGGWSAILGHYAQSYPNLEIFNLETLMSILGNELAPSIGAVGFPYLSRIRSIISSLEYRVVLMFRDPMTVLAARIDHLAQEGSLPDRRTLITLLRNISEAETFELSNPVMRRLLKAPGEQVSAKDVTTALRQLTQFDLVATDRTRNLLVATSEEDPVFLAPPHQLTERQHQIATLLRQIGLATDMIAEDLALYELTSGAITRACEKTPSQPGQRVSA